MKKSRECRLCGQKLRTPEAIERVRQHGSQARKLTPRKRSTLRRALAERERKRLNAKGKNIPGHSMREIAERCGCSRRTAIREREWMLVDGSMEKALKGRR